MIDAPYQLYYWPNIPGRGEFIRLAFEEAGAQYVDVARRPENEGGGIKAMMRLMREGKGLVPFAPPFLKVGEQLIAQTPNILAYLAPRLHLIADDEASRVSAHQLQLTILDLVNEAHDVHHPIASSLYYEDQKAEAKRRAPIFLAERVTKFLGYFERVIEKNEAGQGVHVLGSTVTYVDLSLFQVMSGLTYAFPRAMKKLAPKMSGLRALADHVAARPRVAAYLASSRRVPFNEHGIFRHYPELDEG